MIFAAGLGTRLKPITDTMPKALVPVAGRPLIAHVMARLQAAGVDDFVVNVHHFADQIITYLAEHQQEGVTVAVSDERDGLLETGGAILKAEPLLGGDDFLVHNVDILSDLDLEWFMGQMRPGAVSTLLVSERVTQRYFLFDDDMRLVGWTNVATGEVRTPFEGLDVSRCRKLAFAGIHGMSAGIFDAMRALGFEGRFSIVDFYLKAAAEYAIYGVVAEDLTLVDVGKLSTLEVAEEFCRTHSEA